MRVMLSFLILTFICVGYRFCFKKTFIIVVVLASWLMHFSLLPNASLFQIISILTVIFFFIDKGSFRFSNGFFFTTPILLLSISYLITTIFSGGKFHLFYVVASICTLSYLYIFWDIAKKDKECLKLFAYCTLVYGVFIGVYALVETLFQFNPIVEYFVTNNLYRQDFIIDQIRFGFKRSQSIFSMHTTSGAVCITIAATLFYLKYYTDIFKRNRIILSILLLLSLGVFFTGARSAIIGYVLVLFSFFPLFKKENLKYVIIVMFLFFVGGHYFMTIIDSILDTQSVGGSDADMRFDQFTIGQYFLQKSPWIGNGVLFTSDVAIPKFPELLGAESIWLPVMMDYGLLGIISHVLLIIYGIMFCVKKKRPWLSMYIIGFATFFTLSSIPCFELIFPLITVIYMVEASPQLKKRSNNIFYGRTNEIVNHYSHI